jgi:probable F420-dependent oxidoreductase
MMKIDGPFYASLDNAAAEARRLAAAGYDGVYTLEGNTDPFFPLVVAAEHAPGLDIATGIAVAFPRNPLHMAYQAWDLHKFSKGHFILGLGSQIRPHIVKRFGCEFDPPARRMKELIQATKAFFDCFQDGKELNFEGEFYRHTLMTPMFDAGPNDYGKPPILLGGLGPMMTAVAGEVADGLIVHPFNSLAFVEQNAMPALQRGLDRAQRKREDITVSIAAICITGNNEQEYQAAKSTVKNLLGFYGSTPAYRPPMDAVGMGELQPELNRLSKLGQWQQMGERVDDDFVAAFAVTGEPHTIAQQLWDKYGNYADRLSIYAPYQTDPDVWPGIIAELKRLSGR